MEHKRPIRFSYSSFFLPPSQLRPLLPPLREFEVSEIVKFVPTPLRLKVLMLLSRSWLTFIFKNYSWIKFPTKQEVFLESGFLSFFDSFQSLGGIEVPYLPGKFLTPRRLAMLGTAQSIAI